LSRNGREPRRGKSKVRNKFKKEIVSFLQKKKGKSFSRKEISKALGVQKSNYQLYRDALRDLSRSQQIIRAKGGKFQMGGGGAAPKKVQGTIQMTRKGFAFVTDEQNNEDIFIAAQYLNTALDQDQVKIQLFASSKGRNKEGHVVKVLSRSRNSFVGTYHKSEYYGFVTPDDPKVYRDFYVADANSKGSKNGQKVVVKLDKWEGTQLNPEGSIIEILGYPNEPGVDISSVVKGFGLPLKFNKRIEKEASQIQLEGIDRLLKDRLDLREWITITIDPEDAKDFDDAVSLSKLKNGNYQLGVHVADVSYFVGPNSLIDQEGLERGTSIYLVDRVIPMLPEHLSNELCSLQPNQQRLTYSCIMELTPEGKVANYHLQPSVIINKRRFNYDEVQDIIDSKDSGDKYDELLKEMHHLSRNLRKNRFIKGSIDFNTPEVRFKLNEHGKPVEIIPVKRLQSMEMIEEFMLLANQTVTIHVQKKLLDDKPYPFIYRVHEKPDKEKLQNFDTFLKALGYKVQIKKNMSPGDFQTILQKIEGTQDEILVKEVALRTMMKATYSEKNVGHFGLAFDFYTHFTSPIRRYPDLMVHRLLKEYEQPISQIRNKELEKILKKVSKKSSERERLALEAERESIKVKQVEWIEQHQGEEFEGLISGVISFGLFVEITPYLIEGLVHIDSMVDDFYIYEEKTYSLIGKDIGKIYRLGDGVKVKVAKVDRQHNTVDFELVVGEN
jgi:ribonuclease R